MMLTRSILLFIALAAFSPVAFAQAPPPVTGTINNFGSEGGNINRLHFSDGETYLLEEPDGSWDLEVIYWTENSVSVTLTFNEEGEVEDIDAGMPE